MTRCRRDRRLIPTRNRPVELATTLAGLAAQDHPFDLVISDQSDGAPSFGTPPAQTMLRVLRAAGHRVDAVVHTARHGVAEHRAALLARSTARYALFLDDDIGSSPAPSPDCTRRSTSSGAGWSGPRCRACRSSTTAAPPSSRRSSAGRGGRRPSGSRPTPRVGPLDAHNAANPLHLAQDHVRPWERWVPYKIAWVAGCVLYDRAALDAVGGFDFWRDLPPAHCAEDVVAEPRVIAVRRRGHPAVGVSPGVADDGARPRARREQSAGRAQRRRLLEDCSKVAMLQSHSRAGPPCCNRPAARADAGALP